MGEVADRMRAKLERAFSPTRLEIVDDSERHQGHAGHNGAGESHFNLLIEAPAFAGVTRVERQRMINRTLAMEIGGPVHALAIKALAPGE
jgi:BolA protein